MGCLLALPLLLCSPAPVAAFDLQGHRGARGLAPENTMAAFRKALAIGVSTLELDLALTRDGVLVVAHDPYVSADLARDPDGRWLAARGPLIRSLSLEELLRYDIGRVNPASAYAKQWPLQQGVDGERYPTFAQVLDLARADARPVRLNVETKIFPDRPGDTADPRTFATAVVAAIDAAGMTSRTTVQSFDWRTLRAVHSLAPGDRHRLPDHPDRVERQRRRPRRQAVGVDRRPVAGGPRRLGAEAGQGGGLPVVEPVLAQRRCTRRWPRPGRSDSRSCRGRSTTRRRWDA